MYAIDIYHAMSQPFGVVQDPCHDLAWILDAAIAHSRDAPEQGQEGGVLKPAHMASLKKFFRDFDSKASTFMSSYGPSKLSIACLRILSEHNTSDMSCQRFDHCSFTLLSWHLLAYWPAGTRSI